MIDNSRSMEGEMDDFLSTNKAYVSFLLINPGGASADQAASDVVKQNYAVRWSTVVRIDGSDMVLAAVVTSATDSTAMVINAIQSLVPQSYQVASEFKVVNGEYYKLVQGVVERKAHNGWP